MPADAQNTNLSIMAAATPADYTRDPTRWGSVEMAAHFPDFNTSTCERAGQ